ncbi:MAG: Flp pilus assembly protein CpaB [Rhodobacteraceae bacterium]|nr:Flp pilus assembly protein CpaB [Paracoccaceae bacterium]MBR26089.1 Flp pilus assembly protein CpaB [Paracoccaceae bacterium]
MRSLAVFVFVAGLALAGGAAWYVFAQVQAAESRMAPANAVATVPVAVANKSLKFGQPITAADVKVVQWPAEILPENSFNSPEDLFGADGKPRTVLRRMEPNELILRTKVTGFGERATVMSLLEPGMRAYTMPVNAASSVGGFVLPGSRIDVFLTVNDRRNGLTTRTLIENIEVIAVDQDTDPDRIEAKVARTVTLQGTPAQVQQLTLASELGNLSIALRGFGATDAVASAPIDRAALLGEVEAVEVAEPEPEPEPEVKVIVRRGNQVEVRTMP